MNIFISNLDGSITAGDLRRAFSGYGTIIDAAVVTDTRTGKTAGLGQVYLVPEKAAREAIEELHLAPLRGRLIKVRECVYRAKRDRRAGRSAGLKSERRQSTERRRHFTGVNPLNPPYESPAHNRAS
ncbi:MAG: RNA-binding protein [Gammaproteobacteria bacterium]|nr:RNA-binding protein [Gammaproteobacteria bacterium]